MLGETMAKIRAKDREDAKLEGWNEGWKEGRKEGMQDVARNMLKEGYTVDLISSLTEIPKSDIEKMQVQQV